MSADHSSARQLPAHTLREGHGVREGDRADGEDTGCLAAQVTHRCPRGMGTPLRLAAWQWLLVEGRRCSSIYQSAAAFARTRGWRPLALFSIDIVQAPPPSWRGLSKDPLSANSSCGGLVGAGGGAVS